MWPFIPFRIWPLPVVKCNWRSPAALGETNVLPVWPLIPFRIRPLLVVKCERTTSCYQLTTIQSRESRRFVRILWKEPWLSVSVSIGFSTSQVHEDLAYVSQKSTSKLILAHISKYTKILTCIMKHSMVFPTTNAAMIQGWAYDVKVPFCRTIRAYITMDN